MTVKEYMCKHLPDKFGVHQCNKLIANWVFNQEIEGNAAFAHENFKDAAERAKLITPYQVDNLEELVRVRKVAELLILYHRIFGEEHKEDHSDRIQFLLNNVILTDEESTLLKDMMNDPEGFWGG